MSEANQLARANRAVPAAASSFIIQTTDESTSVRENVLIWSWLRDKSPNTQKTYERIVREFFKRYSGVSLQAVTTSHVTVFVFEYMAAASPRTRALYLDCIASLFMFLQREGYRPTNPCLPIKRLRIDRKEGMSIPSREQLEHLFRKIRSDRNRLICKMLYYSGFRVSELVGLRWLQFTSKSQGTQITVKGKGGRVRTVMIRNDVYAELRNICYNMEDEYVFRSIRRKGTHLSVRQVETIVAAESKNAGFPINPHKFRHGHASHSLKNGADLKLIQDNLGHRSIATTEIYLQVDPEDSSGLYLD